MCGPLQNTEHGVQWRANMESHLTLPNTLDLLPRNIIRVRPREQDIPSCSVGWMASVQKAKVR